MTPSHGFDPRQAAALQRERELDVAHKRWSDAVWRFFHHPLSRRTEAYLARAREDFEVAVERAHEREARMLKALGIAARE
jgi:hypothetical protein